ncbi:MAG: phosphonate C-P lyase system protein PhnG [Turicibacter sp.]|nr:phosphonate C-P lyase system protein PhnG [Turicibacter sp.]
MNRRKRTEILIRGDRALSEAFRQEIEALYEVTTIEEAENGLAMVKMRETAQKSLFYLGEVLITEVKVQVGGKMGIGIIQGDEPEWAYDLAVIDAAYNANLIQTGKWNQQLLDEARKIETAKKQKHAQILKTKVNFDVMDT